MRRLLADAMLGGLARWLRILGFDVAHDPALDDAAVVDKALREGRTILTRDRLLVRRKKARDHLLIASVHLPEQLAQVIAELGLEVSAERLLSRCLRCNVPLAEVPAAEARREVPPFVARTQERFRRCPSCGRLYWPATHARRMRRRLAAWGVLGVEGEE